MTMAIVDLLEVIEIQHRQGTEFGHPAPGHQLHEAAPVEQTGERIVARLLAQGQCPVLGAEQQHPEGGEVTAHQHGEERQHVDTTLIHQDSGIPCSRNAMRSRLKP